MTHSFPTRRSSDLNYCGHVGLEYMHIADVEERRFLQERMEGADKRVEFTREGKQAILKKVIEAGAWEKFLAKKRSEEHTSELQSLMRISYAVFCLTKKTQAKQTH